MTTPGIDDGMPDGTPGEFPGAAGPRPGGPAAIVPGGPSAQTVNDRSGAAGALDHDLAELGRALGRRSAGVAVSIVDRWERRHGFGGTEHDLALREEIRETTELATNAVARYLITRQSPTQEQAGAMSRSGRAPVEDRLSLSGLTRLYLFWRDATTDAVHEEAIRLESPRAVTDAALEVVRAGADSAMVGMAKQFDAAYAQLRSQLADEQDHLAHLAHHDPLTGLANRALLLEELRDALAPASGRPGSVLGVLFVDVDRFKAVNDRAGHQIGDAFLSVVADRLRHALRPGDTASRFGGDEFVVLCRDLAGGEVEASTVAARIVSTLSVQVVVGGIRFAASASVGVALAVPGDDPEAVLSRADEAMYRAKRLGRGRYEIAPRSRGS